MEEIANLPSVTPKQLKYVQQCCLFLGVTTLADITNSKGTTLTEWVLSHQGRDIRVHDLAIVAKNSDICAKILHFPSFFFLF
jgi:hypothetical protein